MSDHPHVPDCQRRMTTRKRSLLGQLMSDRSGISGLEFALLLPLIIALFAATLDLGEALMVNRRLNQIATTTSDITSQEPTWTASSIQTLVEGTSSMLTPFDATALKVQVSVLNVSSTGTATVAWSYGYHTAALSKGAASPVAIPATIAESGVQMVVTVVDYNLTTVFTSLLSKVTGLESYHLGSTALSRPRVGNAVELL